MIYNLPNVNVNNVNTIMSILTLDTAITIKSPSSGSLDMKSQTKTFKLTLERKL